MLLGILLYFQECQSMVHRFLAHGRLFYCRYFYWFIIMKLSLQIVLLGLGYLRNNLIWFFRNHFSNKFLILMAKYYHLQDISRLKIEGLSKIAKKLLDDHHAEEIIHNSFTDYLDWLYYITSHQIPINLPYQILNMELTLYCCYNNLLVQKVKACFWFKENYYLKIVELPRLYFSW